MNGRYRVRRDVVTEVFDFEDVNGVPMVTMTSGWMRGYGFTQGFFDALFEPIPESEDKPADPDSVTVRRETLKIVLGDAEDVAAKNKHRTVLADCCAELRSVLGEKACEHKQTKSSRDPGQWVVNREECSECGMVRTLGDWQKPEQK